MPDSHDSHDVQVFIRGAGRLLHSVVFRLKGDAPADTAEQMIEFYRTEVPKAPGVLWVFAGPPRPSDREVVDDGFTLSTATLFESSEAEVVWQDHPIHKVFIERFAPWFDSVIVYDVIQ